MDNLFKDKGFWDTFVKDHWEQKPFASDSVFKSLPIDEDLLFNAVINSLENYSGRIFTCLWLDSGVEKFYPGNPLYPNREDKSFKGYHNRMTKQLEGKSYYLLLNHLEADHFDIWNFGRSFLNGLYEKAGFNKLGTATNLFIGSDNTPFGVHQDFERDSVFHIPVIGKKAMRTWPEEYGRNNPELAGKGDYTKFIPESTRIEAIPGGFVYWPSGLWHISEKADDFSVSLAVALTCQSNLTWKLLDKLKAYSEMIPANTAANRLPYIPKDSFDFTIKLPEEFVALKNNIMSFISEEMMMLEWVKIITAFNFTYLPPPIQDDIKIDLSEAEIMATSRFPIVCAQIQEQLCISANGQIIIQEYNPDYVAIIQQINKGQKLSSFTLLSQFKNIRTESFIHLLTWLKRVRAIEISG